MTSAPDQDRAPIELPHRVRLEILGAVLLGIFLAALDQTIVGTALPVIVTELNGNEFYVWAFTAYLVTSTISGPIYGKLSDLYGRRPIFIIGILIFLLGSILSGLSQEMWQLIAFRGLQGLGAGALFPIALAIIADIFAPSERGKYQGFFGAVFGLSFLLGPALGGLITDNFGWRWIFYINVPLGAVVLLIIRRTLPTVRDPNAERNLDFLGASLFIAALLPFLIGLTNKQFGEWTDPAVSGLIAIGFLFGAAFVWAESRAKEPIIPLALFKHRAFTASVSAIFLAAMGFFAVVVFLPRWYQVVGGTSATEAGYQILPLLGGLIISAVASGQIVARTGRYKALIFGALIVFAIGLYLLTNLRDGHARANHLAVDGRDRPRRRAHVRRLHAHRPELGARPAAGGCDEQRHALPAARRHHRPGLRGHDLRLRDARGGAPPDGCRRGSGADRLGIPVGRQLDAEQPVQRRRPRRDDPVPGAGGVPSAGGAIHSGHGGRHPRGDLDRHRLHVRGRHRDGAARGVLVLVLLPGVKMGEGSEPVGATDRTSTPVPSTD